MNVQIAVLCDAATEAGGKLSLLGAFDTIHASQLPATHMQCSIALRVTFNQVEEGSHKLRLSFVDEDGKSLLPQPIELPVDVSVPPETHFVTRNFIVNIQQLKFDKPGQYSIDLALDGRQEASIPLLVKYNPATTPVND